MGNLIELDICEAALIYGGKNEQTARLVEFIAECIGSLAKAIYTAYNFKKYFLTPCAR